MNKKSAILLPAFITDYTHKELDILLRNNIEFTKYLKTASDTLEISMPQFSYDSNAYKNDELLAQIIAYLFGCSFFDLLIQKGIKPDFGAGYSMGIYANLYAAGSISLSDGILIINKAFNLVNELASTGEYGMGGIIGLSQDDVNEILQNKGLNAEIINVNSEHSIVIAGEKIDIERTLKLAKNEGALNTVELNVKTPYHSGLLSIFGERFQNYIESIHINNPRFKIVSTYDQRDIVNSTEIRNELVYNLTCKINWYKTMQELLNKGVTEFYECGAGKDLLKIARFIDGDFVLIPMHKL